MPSPVRTRTRIEGSAAMRSISRWRAATVFMLRALRRSGRVIVRRRSPGSTSVVVKSAIVRSEDRVLDRAEHGCSR
jgi:hypothetical protein